MLSQNQNMFQKNNQRENDLDKYYKVILEWHNLIISTNTDIYAFMSLLKY